MKNGYFMMTKLNAVLFYIFLTVIVAPAQARFVNTIDNNTLGNNFYYPTEPVRETTPNPPKLKIYWVTDNSIKLKWKDNSYVEEGFRVELLVNNGQWILIERLNPLPSKDHTENLVIPSLYPNEEYCFRVVAYNENGDSGGLTEPLQEACATTAIVLDNSCPGSFIDSVLELATNNDSEISISCNLTLRPGQYVTKRLIMEGSAASNITVNLNGATLMPAKDVSYRGPDRVEIRSIETREKDNENFSIFDNPENITLKKGNITGAVRIWGMAKNAKGEHYKNSSRTSTHVARVRSNAPRKIILDALTITGTGRNPVYFSAGVTRSKLINSEVKGVSNAVAIYLEAESSNNIIKNNSIHVSTKNHVFESWDRPLIAIDGSSHNKIINNHFSNLSHGGIYLYRNCGESGVIRHTAPEWNHIINNRFYYNRYTGKNPAVHLSSHDRGLFQQTFGFCDDDAGYPYGSSVSDKDYARYNKVMQNQFFGRKVWVSPSASFTHTIENAQIIPDYVKTSNPSLNTGNIIDYNQIINTGTVNYNRLAGCYVEMENRGFMLDKESFEINPEQCNGSRYTCMNGELVRETIVNSSCARVGKLY